jgi:hypothetical protein
MGIIQRAVFADDITLQIRLLLAQQLHHMHLRDHLVGILDKKIAASTHNNNTGSATARASVRRKKCWSAGRPATVINESSSPITLRTTRGPKHALITLQVAICMPAFARRAA